MAEPRRTLPTYSAPGARFLIVEARYYDDIGAMLHAGAARALEAAGATHETIGVPGALEIPAAIKIALASGAYAGALALGCVIRGETTHYDTVCNDSSRAITLLGLQGACIGNGILTVENREQALVRAEVAGQNKGGGAAAAARHRDTDRRAAAVRQRAARRGRPAARQPAGRRPDRADRRRGARCWLGVARRTGANPSVNSRRVPRRRRAANLRRGHG